jgi:hypothetical protein
MQYKQKVKISKRNFRAKVGKRRLPVRGCLQDTEDLLDHLIEVEVSGVDADGVGGLAKRCCEAGRVLFVTGEDVALDPLQVHCDSPLCQLFPPPPRPLLDGSIYEELEAGVRKDDGPDIPPLDDKTAGGCDLSLDPDEDLPHGGDVRRVRGDRKVETDYYRMSR